PEGIPPKLWRANDRGDAQPRQQLEANRVDLEAALEGAAVTHRQHARGRLARNDAPDRFGALRERAVVSGRAVDAEHERLGREEDGRLPAVLGGPPHRKDTSRRGPVRRPGPAQSRDQRRLRVKAPCAPWWE